MSIIFFVLFVEASVVIVCKFQRNRSTFEYEFEYEYECVANFMDIMNVRCRIRRYDQTSDLIKTAFDGKLPAKTMQAIKPNEFVPQS